MIGCIADKQHSLFVSLDYVTVRGNGPVRLMLLARHLTLNIATNYIDATPIKFVDAEVADLATFKCDSIAHQDTVLNIYSLCLDTHAVSIHRASPDILISLEVILCFTCLTDRLIEAEVQLRHPHAAWQ